MATTYQLYSTQYTDSTDLRTAAWQAISAPEASDFAPTINDLADALGISVDDIDSDGSCYTSTDDDGNTWAYEYREVTE